MEELLIGFILLWAVGRNKKKKDPTQMPGPTGATYPVTSGGASGPAYNPNNSDGGPGGGRPGVL
jgi:hypothetical protein